jgi:hypothetical protein
MSFADPLGEKSLGALASPRDYNREEIWRELSKILAEARKENFQQPSNPNLTTRLHFFSLIYHAMVKGDFVEIRRYVSE